MILALTIAGCVAVAVVFLGLAWVLSPAGAGAHTEGNRARELAQGVAWQASELAGRLRRHRPAHRRRLPVYALDAPWPDRPPEIAHEPSRRELAAVEAGAAPLSAPRVVPQWVTAQLAVTGFVIDSLHRAAAHPWPWLDRRWEYATGTFTAIDAAMTP